jgi:hypothetical protein
MPARFIYEGDEDAAHQHLSTAQNLLYKVRTMAATSGTGVAGLNSALDDDGYIYVLKVGETEVVHVFVAPQSEVSFEEPTAQFPLDFLSGVTRGGTLQTKVIPLADGSTRTIKQLDSFKPTAACAERFHLKGGYALSPRLGVAPWSAFFEYADPNGRTSQYSALKPAMYSGLMRKCVQVVLGYGFLPTVQIPVTGRDKQLYQQYGVQIRYDYRWMRTHGIVKAADDKLWLVEIGISNGVIATPLPLAPNTAHLADPNGDARAQAAHEFKGLPSGLAFPTGSALQKAIKAGTVIQLAPASALSDFYSMAAYSTAMGWSFSDDGSEAHNTGWTWGDDNIRRARHYSLQIHIGALKTDLQPNEPIADGSAVLTLVSEGKLYHPSKNSPPPIKFYEPLLPGLLSVEMLASNTDFTPDTSAAGVPLCDCTMHVCHVNGQLKLVKYFWDRTVTNPAPKTTNDFTDCMFIGSWYSETDQTFVAIPPTFHTTDFDDRAPPDSTTQRTDITSSDMGKWFYSVGDELDMSPIPCWGFAQKSRRYRTVTTTKFPAGHYNRGAIVVPAGMRDGYVYANLDFNSGGTTATTIDYNKSLLHPKGYLTYRTFYHPPGPGTGCYTQYDRKVYSEYSTTDDTCTIDMLGDDSWLNLCDNADLLPKPPPVPLATSTTVSDPDTQKVTAYLVCDNDQGIIQLKPQGTPDRWLAKSPDEFDNIQFMFATWSCFGALQVAYDEEIDGAQSRLGNLIINDGSGHFNYDFIGVL